MQNKINLSDFPDDIYIILEEDYRKKLYNLIIKKFSSLSQLANKLNIPLSTMQFWFYGKRRLIKKVVLLGFPVYGIKKISKLLGIPLMVIEKHVIAYRSQGGKLITHVRIPIPIDESIVIVISHLLGDGYCPEIVSASPMYTNTSYKCIERFIKNLRIFGKLSLKLYKRKRGENREIIYDLRFSNVIPFILSSFFKISFKSNKGRIPTILKDSSKKQIIQIIKSFILDEAHIREEGVSIGLCNKKLIQDLRELCLKLNYKIGKIRKNNNQFSFLILRKSLKQLKKDIGKLEINQKEEALNFSIKTIKKRGQRGNVGVTKKSILSLLMSKGPLPPKEISRILSLRTAGVVKHIKDLKSYDIVGIKGKKKQARIWKVLDTKKASEFLYGKSTLLK